MKLFSLKGYQEASGHIISWCYLSDLEIYAIKRTNGIDYLKSVRDFQEAYPHFDLMVLGMKRLIYGEEHEWAKWLSKKLWEAYKFNKWDVIRPTRVERIEDKAKIDPNTNLPKVVLKYAKPCTLKKIPLREMPQDFTPHFKWWYYDNHTGEAVISLVKNGKGETIRVLEPMWLINLSLQDIDTLYYNKMMFRMEDMMMALQFEMVIRICFAYQIHAGADLTKCAKLLRG